MRKTLNCSQLRSLQRTSCWRHFNTGTARRHISIYKLVRWECRPLDRRLNLPRASSGLLFRYAHGPNHTDRPFPATFVHGRFFQSRLTLCYQLSTPARSGSGIVADQSERWSLKTFWKSRSARLYNIVFLSGYLLLAVILSPVFVYSAVQYVTTWWTTVNPLTR